MLSRDLLRAAYWIVAIRPVEEEYVQIGTDDAELERHYVIATYRRPLDGHRVRYRFSLRSDN